MRLSTAETTVVDADQLGRIEFIAPSEASGTDAILVGASIYAEADDTFAADNNATELVFATGASEAATEQMRIASDGKLGINTATPAYLLDVQGTVGITGATTMIGALTAGVDGTGHNVIFYGDTSGAYMKWDQASDDLQLIGAAGLDVAGDIDIDGTANLDIVDIDGDVDCDGAWSQGSTITVGSDGTGHDVLFYSATASRKLHWDESADELILWGKLSQKYGSAFKNHTTASWVMGS